MSEIINYNPEQEQLKTRLLAEAGEFLDAMGKKSQTSDKVSREGNIPNNRVNLVEMRIRGPIENLIRVEDPEAVDLESIVDGYKVAIAADYEQVEALYADFLKLRNQSPLLIKEMICDAARNGRDISAKDIIEGIQ